MASVVVAFGSGADSARGRLSDLRSDEVDALIQAAREHDKENLELAAFPKSVDPRVLSYMQRCLLIIDTCRDQNTGSVVRSPTVQPPLARDWPRDGAWVTHALDLAGRQRHAERLLRFYLLQIRRRYSTGKPIGTLPESVYADGVEASPHYVVDVEAPAALLWAVWRHGTFLGEEERNSLYAETWESVNLCADFLVRWRDARRGAPMGAPDPVELRDPLSLRQALRVREGLSGAALIARSLGQPVPRSWQDRMKELGTLLRYRLHDPEEEWVAVDPRALAVAARLEPDLPLAGRAFTTELSRLSELRGPDAARTLVALAWYARTDPELARRLTELLPDTLSRALDGTPPDSLTASLCIIGAYSLSAR